MRAPFEMNVGQERLRKIIDDFPAESSHWNEAQNRFQFVDRLLTECLGWERPDMEVEKTDEAGGRADYILGSPAKAVLEAKRESKLWSDLPTGSSTTVRKIKPFLKSSKEFEAAVLQVIPYCTLRGAPIAIICNGPQLAIFQAITIGQEPLEGDCYYLCGFDEYVKNFPLLWTLLSPEGVTENRALRDLSRHRSPRIPPKASVAIPEPNRYRYRDALQEELRQIGSLLLEEIEDNPSLKPEFFKECYVPLEANNRHLLLSKRIIGSRYKRVGADGVVPSSLDGAAKAGQLGDQYTANAGSRPIVVIGDVGVGKTSFFENLLLNIDASKDSKTIYININLGIKATLTSDLKAYILEIIPVTLREKYGIDVFDRNLVEAIYHEELASFDRSVEGQLKDIDANAYLGAKIEFLKRKTSKLDTHLLAVFGHLAHGRKRRIILVLDNADQRSFEVQQDAFLIAQELAATRSMFVFLALRPSTFYVSKTTGALSAYQNKILTISPPPADVVVEKRIGFALRVAEGKAAPAALDGIRLNLTSIVVFLRATLRSIRNNDEIRQFLSNITSGNTRAVIELITSFCGSPNVDARKIVELEQQQGDYRVPLHEFTKHALLGEFSYYNPQSSFVACNIYDVTLADPREHFLAALIVGYLSSNLGIRDNDGFLSGEAIVAEMVRNGFLEEQILGRLRKLATSRIIETPHAHFREVSVPETRSAKEFHYRATSVGIYHIRHWAGSFSFLDAVSTDTPIFDEAARTDVTKLASSFDIKDRLTKAVRFKSYLESRWHLASINVNYFDLPTLFDAQNRSFEDVSGVVRGRGQPRPALKPARKGKATRKRGPRGRQK